MTIKINRMLLKPYWLVFILFTTTVSVAQQNKIFSGKLKLGEYSGQAKYSYQVIGIDTIFNGPFSLSNSSLEALLKANDSSFSIVGNFEEGVPTDKWTFQFGEFYTDSTTQVSGFQYQVNINGKQLEAKGDLKSGKPEGVWRFSENNIKDSKIQDTLFFSEINFEDGVPQRSFRIEDSKGTLVGRFLRDGKAHDAWSLFSDEDGRSENWYFENGRLTKIRNEINGVTEERLIYNSPLQNTRIVPLDKGYLKLIFLNAAKANEGKMAVSNIGKLLLENGKNYGEIETILSHLGSSGFGTNIQVEVPYYPMDSTARQRFKEAIALIIESKEGADSFLNNTQLNILKRSDEEAEYLFNVVRAFQTTYLEPLQRAITLIDLGIIAHISREELIAHLFPSGVPSKTLGITSESGQDLQDFEGVNMEKYDFNGESLEAIFQITNYVHVNLENISRQLNAKLSKDKKEQEFVALEEKMIALANQLKIVPDSIAERLSNKEKKALKSIDVLAEKLLSDYAEMENGDEKLAKAKSSVSCLTSLEQLTKEITTLPEKSEELQTNYKDAVWNPFTATIMDEMVKKKITAAYKNVLLPHILETVTNSLTCTNAAGIDQLMKNTHKRMLEMRNEDTKKLERRLKREQDPAVVLELFKLQSIKN